MPRTAAIVLAAGAGRRFGATTPKQFCKVHGRYVLSYTLDIYEQADLVDVIVLVVSAEEAEARADAWQRVTKPLHVVTGGATRQESVFRGLVFARQRFAAELCSIHNGVSPLASVELVETCIRHACQHAAASACVEVFDTIAARDDCRVSSVPARDRLCRLQSPQVFHAEVLEDLHRRAREDSILDATNDVVLARRYGYDVFLVKGEHRNIKITTKEDLLFMEACLTHRLTETPLNAHSINA